MQEYHFVRIRSPLNIKDKRTNVTKIIIVLLVNLIEDCNKVRKAETAQCKSKAAG